MGWIGLDIMTEKQELKSLSIIVTQAVCDIFAWCSKEETNRLNYLRNKLGIDYDAVNQVWTEYNG